MSWLPHRDRSRSALYNALFYVPPLVPGVAWEFFGGCRKNLAKALLQILNMRTQFTALQTVALSIHDEVLPVEHYLRQPQRLIHALIEPSRVEQLSPSLFRFKLSPLKFLMLKIQPTVDLEVWTDPDHTLCLRSVATELR
ncbi:MAG: DUF1997 domain-containing protein, partial [Prochlorothrix sp.]